MEALFIFFCLFLCTFVSVKHEGNLNTIFIRCIFLRGPICFII